MSETYGLSPATARTTEQTYPPGIPAGLSRTLLSVRGEAIRMTEPDQAIVSAALHVIADGKAEAARLINGLLDGLLAAFGGLGGVARDSRTARSPLTWSAHSYSSFEQHGPKADGLHGPTGRHEGSLGITLEIRDFSLIGPVTAALNSVDELQMQSVSWQADADNSAWAGVRSDAIEAALLKGQDYAAALGGTVIAVEHVADSGLLGGAPESRLSGWQRAATGMEFASQSAAGLSFDPVPQQLNAVIEARLVATVGPLPERTIRSP